MCVPLYWEHTLVSSPLTGGGSVCLHTQIHTPAVMTGNRGLRAPALGHERCHGRARALDRREHRTSYDVHPDRRGDPTAVISLWRGMEGFKYTVYGCGYQTYFMVPASHNFYSNTD